MRNIVLARTINRIYGERTMKKSRLLGAVCACFLLFGYQPAQAITLWDQQPDTNFTAIVDQVFPDEPTFSTYLVSDVVFASNVTIDSVTTYFSDSFGSWPANATAILNIFADDGALDTEDPTAGTSIAATFSVGADGLELMASGLGINLSAGTYWIGLTPVLDSATYGQEFHQAGTAVVGAQSQLRNPGGAFGNGSDWFDGFDFAGHNYDGAITIEGSVVPVPAAVWLFGSGLLGLIGIARKKAT